MRIGIIGAGNVGGNLGKAWGAKGHEIVYGVRNPGSPRARATVGATAGARLATLAEAAAFGEVVVIAVPGSAVAETLPQLGELSGKIVVDTTNRFGSYGADAAPSSAQYIARKLPRARVVKAYNTIAADHLLRAQVGGGRVAAFIAADDSDARATVMQLSTELGLDAVDLGGLSVAPALEQMVFVYRAAAASYGRNVGFSLLRG